MSLFTSLIPSMVTIALAFTTKIIWLSLLLGTIAGGLITTIQDHEVWWRVFTNSWAYIWKACSNESIRDVIIFVVLIGGFLALLEKGKAFSAFSTWLRKHLTSAKSTRVTTWIMSLCLFLDDYLAVLVAGASLRSVNMHYGVSPSITAYVVDTGALMASIMVTSTWAAYESSVMFKAGTDAGITGKTETDYIIEAMPYQLFTILAFILTFLVSFTGKWFGYKLDNKPVEIDPEEVKNGSVLSSRISVDFSRNSMSSDGTFSDCDSLSFEESDARDSEKEPLVEATEESDVEQEEVLNVEDESFFDEDSKKDTEDRETAPAAAITRPVNQNDLIVPIVTLLVLTIAGLIIIGRMKCSEANIDPTLTNMIGNAPSVRILIATTIIASFVTLYRSRGRISLRSSGRHYWEGIRDIIAVSAAILLANCMSQVATDLNTGVEVANVMKEAFSAKFTPAVVFVIACLCNIFVASSFAAFALVFPIAYPLALASGFDNDSIKIFSAAVITGAVSGALLIPFSDKCLLTSSSVGIPADYHAKTMVLQNIFLIVIALGGFIMLGHGSSLGLTYLVCISLVLIGHFVFAKESNIEFRVSKADEKDDKNKKGNAQDESSEEKTVEEIDE